MISIDDIKSSLEVMKDTQNIDHQESNQDSIKFNKGGEDFFISILNGDSVSKTKIKLSKALMLSKSDSMTQELDELVMAKMNLTSDSNCKVSYISAKDGRAVYIIQNIFSDKIDTFENIIADEKKATITLLILQMIIEIFECVSELFEVRTALIDSIEGSKHGK